MSARKPNEYKIALFGAIAGVICTAIYDRIKELPLLTTLKNVLRWFWNSVLNYKISLWVIILTAFVLYLIIRLIKGSKSTDQISFDWFNYTEEHIANVKWKWDWSLLGSRKYGIRNLRPICPECETPMLIPEVFDAMSIARCPRCDYDLSITKDSVDIMAIIHDNIDRKIKQKSPDNEV